MVVFPKAKINLGLTISGKRSDGYHDIETIFYPLRFSDAMEIVPGINEINNDSLTLTGLELPCPNEENLVLKALRRLREEYPVPILRIHLHKVIPSGAGLGGGSSDAACILSSMNRVIRFEIPAEKLRSIALDLGSDCPFFIESIPAFAGGRGEILKPVEDVLKNYKIVLLSPGIKVNTREAYENCIPSGSGASLMEIIKLPVTEWKDLLINDFENTVFQKYPLIGILKSRLYESGALYSSMSGSGSSVYGIYADEPSVPEDLRKYVIYKGAF